MQNRRCKDRRMMSTQLCKESTSPYESSGGAPLFSGRVLDRLMAMSLLTDCCLMSSDGTKYPVHRVKLLEQSKVFRGLLSDVASTAELPLDEDAATVRLLISSMYDAHNEVDWTTLRTLLELARKYDVEDIQLSCEAFMNTMPLSTSKLLDYMDLAYSFGISSAIKRCQDFLATDNNFMDLVRVHGADWCKDLPKHVIHTTMQWHVKNEVQRRNCASGSCGIICNRKCR